MAKTPAPEAPKDASTSTAGKGKATPSRAEQEAARKRPLVPDTKEAKAQRKAELASARERARIGMANGEQKYLPARDQGPPAVIFNSIVGLHCPGRRPDFS